MDSSGGRGERTENGDISPTGSPAGVGDFSGYWMEESPTPHMTGGGAMGVGSNGWLRPSFLGVGGFASGGESVSLVCSLVTSGDRENVMQSTGGTCWTGGDN